MSYTQILKYGFYGYGISLQSDIPWYCWDIYPFCCDAPGAGNTDGRLFKFTEINYITIHGKLLYDTSAPGSGHKVTIDIKNASGETVYSKTVDVGGWCGQFRLDIPPGTLEPGKYKVEYIHESGAYAYVYLEIQPLQPPLGGDTGKTEQEKLKNILILAGIIGAAILIISIIKK